LGKSYRERDPMSDQIDYETNSKVYDVCKWILDYIRNIAVVITIGVAYKISNSTSFFIIFTIGSLALIGIAQSQINKFIYKPNFMDGKPVVLQTISALLLAGLLFYFNVKITRIVDEAIEFQYAIQNNKTKIKSQISCKFSLDLSGYTCIQ
jgi:hypothetical protein